MKLASFVVSVAAFVGLLAGTQACTSNGAKEDRICTPGANVFCRCADRSQGTKLCSDDGTKFASACSTNADRSECAGGEIDDPNTGKDVDDDGNPVGDDQGSSGSSGTTPTSSPLESCPGKSTAIQPNIEVKIDGDTTGAKDDAKGKAGACAQGSGGADHVYRLIPSGSGSIDIKVQGSGGMNPLWYVRSTCNDEASQVVCAPAGPGSLAAQKLSVVTGREYFLYIDGASGSAGKYTVTAKLTTGTFCGDGQVDSGEACDDGNKTEADGCSNDCQKLTDAATANGCPGQAVHVWQGKTVSASGTTIGKGNSFTKTGTSCTVSTSDLNASPEYVYEVTPHVTGSLVVTLTPRDATFNAQIVARRTCADPGSQGAGMCANLASAGGVETATFSVTNNEKVYVAIDGAVGSKGAFDVTFKIQ
jgi:cysteine-rich repeat protein